MKAAVWIVAITVAVTLAIRCPPGLAQDQEKPWNGKLADGTVIDENDLQRILAEHAKWLNNEDGGKRADLSRAILIGANLSEANLQKTKLRRVDLSEANLQKANLRRADLYEANLQKANLRRASLQWAYLRGADLQNAYLLETNFQNADLYGANLHGAPLSFAKLKGANLSEANLQGVDLRWADLQGALFEIKPNELPNIISISYAFNLSLLRYKNSPHTLVELRKAFKKYGLRRQEREITYAIKHSGYLNAMAEVDFETKLQVIAGRVLFDLTCQWGMAPMRPLKILLIGIIIFSPVYILSIMKRKKYLRSHGYSFKKVPKKDGIWKTWIPERARRDLGGNVPELLSCGWKGAIGLGIYFSVLSAFQVGWKDLNVGSWIARMQPREYRLHASGWVRFVSGLQSLISVYLLALCVLSYLGRPFEGY